MRKENNGQCKEQKVVQSKKEWQKQYTHARTLPPFFTVQLWTTASVWLKTVKWQRRRKLLTCLWKLRVEREEQQT